ncbi:MAG: hypothetical protein HYR62_00875 [Actinobacteria bacterium]|nr:hypothetical protein [Actinomycetota bacterium]
MISGSGRHTRQRIRTDVGLRPWSRDAAFVAPGTCGHADDDTAAVEQTLAIDGSDPGA